MAVMRVEISLRMVKLHIGETRGLGELRQARLRIWWSPVNRIPSGPGKIILSSRMHVIIPCPEDTFLLCQ